MSIPLKQAFIDRVNSDGFLTNELLQALETESPISFRQHPLKKTAPFLEKTQIEWCKKGFYIPVRPNYTLEPLFHAGCFYPQEAGSMVLDTILKNLDIPKNPTFLDLCASPGGKSTLIASYLENKGILVSNEIIHQRARVLKENITKWGYSNCIVTNNEPKDFQRLPSFFDAIVVDAPCSGEGMFRKDQNAREEWSTENVKMCAHRQRDILSDIWSSLKDDGFLIYSTCTFNSSENEDNIKWMLSEFDCELVKIPIPTSFKSGREDIGMYGIPGRTLSEGFFVAVLQKKGSSDSNIRVKKNTSLLQKQKELFDLERFTSIEKIVVYNFNDQLLAIPEESENDFLTLQSNFHILKWGTNLGELARKGIIPSHELAMNNHLLKLEATIPLSKQQALEYLHGDTFTLSGEKGFQLLTYEDEPLGWCKNLGNRFNNLFPKEYRIRMNVK